MSTQFRISMVSGCFLAIALLLAGCISGPNARSGSVAGGLTGGAIGAIAGAPKNKSLEGAAIGALAGTAVGGVIGDQVDREVAQVEAQQQLYLQNARQNAITMDKLIQMTQAGLADQLIINQIHNDGVVAVLSSEDLVSLKENGVSDRVIAAWQKTPPLGTAIPASRGRPVIVEEHHWVDPHWVDPACVPRWWGPPRRHRYGHRPSFYLRF